jgi:phage shock protein PspC (stress-responsive transcriptional regulator)
MEEHMDNKKLYRSQTERMFAGVCGGLGQYAGIDPTVIRVIFALLAVFGGSGLLIYIILMLIIPLEPEGGPAGDGPTDEAKG